MSARTDQLPRVQRVSKVLFGARYRLEIAAWINERGSTPLNPTRLREELRSWSEDPPSHSSVVAELSKLAEADLLAPLVVPGQEVYYERQASTFYGFCSVLRSELLESARTVPAESG
jgi:hypothetical protein